MKCKDITHKIDSEEVLTEADLDHIKNCPSCESVLANNNALEADLEELFAEKDHGENFDTLLIKSIPKKNNILYIAASLLLSVLIVTNPLFIALAEKLPFVEELMQFFERDEEVELAIKQDLPVHDYSSITDQFKLIVKDLYVDKYNLKMQVTVLDENYEIPDQVLVIVDAPTLLRKPIELKLNPEKYWYEIDEMLYIDYISYNSVDVLITIYDGDKKILDKTIQVDTSHLREINYTNYDLNEEIDLGYGILNVESIKMGKLDMSVEYVMPKKKNTVYNGASFTLTDSLGNIYESRAMTAKIFPRVQESIDIFDNLIFDPDAKSFDLTVNSVHYTPIEIIKNIQDEDEVVDFKGNKFTIVRSSYRANLLITLKTEKPVELNEFPRMYYKDGDFWRAAIGRNDKIRAISITQEDFRRVYGDLDTLVTDIQPMLDYFKTKDNINLNEDILKSYINLLLSQPSIYIKCDHFETEMVYDVSPMNYSEPEKINIGYTSDPEKVIIDQTYTFDIQ